MEQSAKVYQPQSLKYLTLAKLPAGSLHRFPDLKDYANTVLANTIRRLNRDFKKTEQEYKTGLAFITQLLDVGADPNYIEPDSGMPILDHALSCCNNYYEWRPITDIANQRFEVTELLLKKGANPNLETPMMPTPFLFHLKKHKYLSWLFLRHGADPNAFGTRYTLLMDVAAYTCGEPVELVKLLLEHGADPRLETERHETALSEARNYKNHHIIPLLEDAMPKKIV